jgi:hypothetical protein
VRVILSSLKHAVSASSQMHEVSDTRPLDVAIPDAEGLLRVSSKYSLSVL